MTGAPMHGLWPSPITPASLAGALRLGELCWDTDGTTVAWLEGRSDRSVIVVRRLDDAAPRDLTPGGIAVRAFVGYGGGDFTLARGAAYFVGEGDQRIYRHELAGGLPRPITPAFGAASTPTVSPDGRWLVYVHSYEGEDCLAVVDTNGARWPARLATGRDFCMQPAWSPDGRRLAWVEWDHPNMPWDGIDLRLATVEAGGDGLPRLVDAAIVAGGRETAVFQPAFTPDGRALLYVSDESGFGQLYRRDLATGSVSRLSDGTGEFGQPAWNHGMRRYAITGSGSVVALRNVDGFDVPAVIGASGVAARPVEGVTNVTAIAASPTAERVALVGSAGDRPPRVLLADLDAAPAAPAVLRRADTEVIPPAALSRPEPVSWTSFDGEPAHGLYYPPASDRVVATGVPPLVVVVHGGPTSQVKAGWDPVAQFLATRGYAVLFPNYRGSTGYGRDYMLRLRGNWGIHDVEDARSGAAALAAQGRADRSRLVIMGGSAGGFTVLQSLITHPGFYRAAICMYGVSNQFTLAADTHKFEARYLDSLLGPLPEAAAVYRERSPIFHADRITDPIALFQGDIDRVVPRAQSDAIAASLRARGVPHEYHVFEGEGHGWRKAETIAAFWTAVERFLREHVLFA